MGMRGRCISQGTGPRCTAECTYSLMYGPQCLHGVQAMAMYLPNPQRTLACREQYSMSWITLGWESDRCWAVNANLIR